VITVIDYKAGNLTSVMKALDALGCEATVTADPEVVRKATQVILPGVGHFQATQLLEETGLTASVSEAIARGVPFLGICVGLQWLFEGSTEAPAVKGLSLFPGECERFAPELRFRTWAGMRSASIPNRA
jgi:glutamine amidotransferase